MRVLDEHGGREKLPIGFQLIGRAFDEAGLLKIARGYEQATAWHEQMPNPDP